MIPPQVHAFFHEASNTVTYVVWDIKSSEGVVIDPVLDYNQASGASNTDQIDKVYDFIKDKGLTITAVLDTHAHADHLSGGRALASRLGGKTRYGIGKDITTVQKTFRDVFNFKGMPVDGSQFDILLDDGDEIRLGLELKVRALHTPGHTPACMTYHIGDALFCGDTLFMPDFGTARCDFPGGSSTDLWHSMQRLLEFPPATRIFVGHDYAPGGRAYAWETTVAQQLAENKHVKLGTTMDEFVKMRDARDAQLDPPRLLFPSLQHNIRLNFGPVEDNGYSYIKIPVNFPLKPPKPPTTLLVTGAASMVGKLVNVACQPMAGVTRVSTDLWIAPQVTDQQLRDLAHHHGLKSVFNLRHHLEDGFMHEEAHLLQSLGVTYCFEPLQMSTLTPERLDEVLDKMEAAERPILVHCASMMRASATTLMHQATRRGTSAEAMSAAAHEMGFDYNARPEMKQLVMGYIEDKIKRAAELPELTQLTLDLWVGPQVTEQQLEDAARKGIRSVLNLRSAAEADDLGMGALTREADIVRKLGMQYVNVPTTAGEMPSQEQLALIESTLDTLPKPVLLHCRTGTRNRHVLRHLQMPK